MQHLTLDNYTYDDTYADDYDMPMPQLDIFYINYGKSLLAMIRNTRHVTENTLGEIITALQKASQAGNEDASELLQTMQQSYVGDYDIVPKSLVADNAGGYFDERLSA